MTLTKNKSCIHFLSRCLTILLFFVFLCVYVGNIDIAYDFLSLCVILISVAEFIQLYYNNRVKNYGLTMMFFLYTLICHNGFVIAYYFNKEYINFKSVTSMAYVNNPYYPKAILIANIVIACYVLFMEVCPINYTNTNRNNQKKLDVGDKIADWISLTLLIIGTGFLGYFILKNHLLFSGYSNVLLVTENQPMLAHMIIITSLSIGVLFSAGTKKGILIGSLVYIITAFLHFSIGNRGEVFYAAIICFALYAIRFKNVKVSHILFLALATIIIIPLVRVVRELRFDSISLNPFTSFLDVLCEEGFQISPFTYIVEYVEEGAKYAFGMTYINDFADFISRRIGLNNPFALEQYIIKSIMPYKGMGFSMIAELYYNFTTVGACIFYLFYAKFMLWLDNSIFYNTISTHRKILCSMIMIEMINLTRNDASTLPVYLTYSIIFYFIYCICKIIFENRN